MFCKLLVAGVYNQGKNMEGINNKLHLN